MENAFDNYQWLLVQSNEVIEQVKCWCCTSKTPPNDVNSHRWCTKSELKIVLYYSWISEALIIFFSMFLVSWYVSEIMKCLSVATMIETSCRSKINWITSKVKMIGKLKISSRQNVPGICPFRYWCELLNVRMTLRTNCLLFNK
jgi:hypothetical protein